MDRSSGCCKSCVSFILTSGLTALFLWLSLRTNDPSCSVQKFYIPALNKTLNSKQNTTLYFTIGLDNPNKLAGIYYDDVDLSFFDSLNKAAVANYRIPRFYQGHNKKAKKRGPAQTVKRAVLKAALPNGTAVFRVDLATAVRFKHLLWNTKRSKIAVGAEIIVNDQGTKVKEKGIKMKKSHAPEKKCHYGLLGLLINCFLFILLNS